MTGLLDCPSCGARMALEPDTRFCNACSRIVKAAPVRHQPAGATNGGGLLPPSVPVREAVDYRGRGLVLILLVCLAGCASRALASGSTAWILPLSAQDQEAVCVITMDYPARRCTTVGEIRSFVRSVKAD